MSAFLKYSTPIKILLIEDDPAHALLVEELLAEATDLAFSLRHADNMASGLAQLATEAIDAVLLDFHLPDSKGVQGVLAARAHAPGVPILVLTALDDRDAALQAMQSGAQDYLIKDELESRLLARSLYYAIERERAEQALRASEQRFKAFMNHSPAWSWIKTASGEFVYASKVFATALGLEPDELLGKTDFDVWPEETARRIQRDDQAVLASGETSEINEIVYPPDGTPAHLLTFKFPLKDSGGGEFVGGVAIDLTARVKAEEALQHQAFHDHLTNMPNRLLFMDRLQHAVARTSGRKGCAAVLFLDLDNFKFINDSLGHDCGDELLIAVSERLRSCVRPGDTVARLGGDEFTILLEDIDEVEYACKVAERVSAELSAPMIVKQRDRDGGATAERHEVFTAASIGIAMQTADDEGAEDLLRHADMAMYEAKRHGKSRYAVFEYDMKARADRRLSLETDLRYALERDELRLYYQPIFDLASNKIVGVEAQTRWQHPQHGLLLPSDFIHIAEQSDLILPLGRWALEQACRQTREWRQLYTVPAGGPPLVAHVNLSARQFGHPQLLADILGALNTVTLAPGELCVEITENLGMIDNDFTAATLRQLQALGVRRALDNFGAGYSALAYLQRCPFNTLKLDRALVAGLGENSESTAIVQAVISFAKALNFNIIAEGIEKEEQLRLLLQLGCDQGQGDYLAPLAPAAAISQLLSSSEAGNAPSWETTPAVLLHTDYALCASAPSWAAE